MQRFFRFRLGCHGLPRDKGAWNGPQRLKKCCNMPCTPCDMMYEQQITGYEKRLCLSVLHCWICTKHLETISLPTRMRVLGAIHSEKRQFAKQCPDTYLTCPMSDLAPCHEGSYWVHACPTDITVPQTPNAYLQMGMSLSKAWGHTISTQYLRPGQIS